MSIESTTNVAPAHPSAAKARPKIPFIGPLALYLLLIAAFFPLFRYLLTPDLISYISIAQHYAHGYWSEAINTYWGPLMSWLMVPLLWMGVPGLLAAKLFCIASGIFLLFSFRSLARLFDLSPPLETATMYTVAIMAVAFSLIPPGPDLLVAALLLFYFAIVFNPDYAARPWAGIVCGLLGVAGFLTKAYLFYFFIAHFALMTALHWLRIRPVDRGPLLRHFAAGMVVFAVGSAPWIWAMSAKAGKFTLGTSGAWNYRFVGPDTPGYPQYYHLMPPPGPHAISMWEDPSLALLPAWSPLHSARDFSQQLRLIGANFKDLTAIVLETSVFGFAAVFAYLIWGIARGEIARHLWSFTIVTIALLPMGYLLVSIRDRYVWAALLLILLAGAVVVRAVAQEFGGLAGQVAIAGFVLSFALLPVRELIGHRNTGRSWYQISNMLRSKIPPHSRLASCGDWNDSIAVAYYLQLPFYGSTSATGAEDLVRSQLELNPTQRPIQPSDPAEIDRSLREDHISYYLVWPDCRILPSPEILHDPVAIAAQQGVKLFHISGATDQR